jgi:GNAT superfamily N-acetyltransferase
MSARRVRDRLGGEEERLVVRPAVAGDRAALEAMFQRSSPATVFRQFHGQVRAFPRAYLDEALAGADAHFAVVCYSGCEAVALASCRTVAPGSAELGILIEDAWQRRGLGGTLLGELVAHAAGHGIGTLRAQMLTEQDWIINMLARHGTWTSAFARGVRDVTLELATAGDEGGSGGGASAAGLAGSGLAAAGLAAARACAVAGRRRADAGPAEFW